VATQTIEQERFSPKLTDLANGIYFLRIHNTSNLVKVQINNRR
jgi:hypothetical protein